MANLVLRYSLFSLKSDIDIEKIAASLPLDNQSFIFKPGTAKAKYISEDYGIDYVYKVSEINSIEGICADFYDTWINYQDVVANMHLTDGFQSYLLFEFNIANSDYPEIIYENKFLTLLAYLKTELQFYFYT